MSMWMRLSRTCLSSAKVSRISAAAREQLYLNWDDVVKEVYADYCTRA